MVIIMEMCEKKPFKANSTSLNSILFANVEKICNKIETCHFFLEIYSLR